MSETKLHDLRGFKAAIARMESIDPPVASPEHELLAVAKWVYEVLDPSPAPAVAERGEPKFIHDDIVSLDGNKKGWVVIDYSFDGEFRYRLMGHDPMGWIAESRLNLLHRKKDLTPKEADRAYDEAPADPISDAEIKRHLAACGINMEPAKERLRAMMAKAREQTPAEPAPSEGESTEQELNMLLHRLWTKAATEASDSYDKQEWLRLEKLLATKPAGMKVFFDGIPVDVHQEMCRLKARVAELEGQVKSVTEACHMRAGERDTARTERDRLEEAMESKNTTIEELSGQLALMASVRKADSEAREIWRRTLADDRASCEKAEKDRDEWEQRARDQQLQFCLMEKRAIQAEDSLASEREACAAVASRQRGEIERLTRERDDWKAARESAVNAVRVLYEHAVSLSMDKNEGLIKDFLDKQAAELAAARKRAEEAEGLLVQVYEQVGNGAAPSRRHALTPGLRDAIRDVLYPANESPAVSPSAPSGESPSMRLAMESIRKNEREHMHPAAPSPAAGQGDWVEACVTKLMDYLDEAGKNGDLIFSDHIREIIRRHAPAADERDEYDMTLADWHAVIRDIKWDLWYTKHLHGGNGPQASSPLAALAAWRKASRVPERAKEESNGR